MVREPEWQAGEVRTLCYESTGTMIKTTRRSAYGFRDTQYFFSKIYENSRKTGYPTKF